jgi:hypothetical protein
VSGVKMGLSGAAIIVEAMNSLLSTFHGGWNLAQVQDTLSESRILRRCGARSSRRRGARLGYIVTQEPEPETSYWLLLMPFSG